MNQKGQTLIELVISITLIVLIITAVTILTVNGLKNSQFSRNQVQAAKLAQEGVENVRTIRDNSFTVCGTSTQSNTILTNGLWGTSCPASGGCRYLIKTTAGICGGTVVNTTALWINYTALNTDSEIINIDGVNFKRSITIVDGRDLTGSTSPNVKEVTSTVDWIDSGGNHSSKVSTVLAKI